MSGMVVWATLQRRMGQAGGDCKRRLPDMDGTLSKLMCRSARSSNGQIGSVAEIEHRMNRLATMYLRVWRKEKDRGYLRLG
jgi:hypothetical protein